MAAPATTPKHTEPLKLHWLEYIEDDFDTGPLHLPVVLGKTDLAIKAWFVTLAVHIMMISKALKIARTSPELTDDGTEQASSRHESCPIDIEASSDRPAHRALESTVKHHEHHEHGPSKLPLVPYINLTADSDEDSEDMVTTSSRRVHNGANHQISLQQSGVAPKQEMVAQNRQEEDLEPLTLRSYEREAFINAGN